MPPLKYEKIRKPGDKVWFEYHCFESSQSKDAELWHRSHQRVKILSVDLGDAKGIYSLQERLECGQLIGYTVQFADGFRGTAMEDELMDSKTEFYRPDPPKKEGSADEGSVPFRLDLKHCTMPHKTRPMWVELTILFPGKRQTWHFDPAAYPTMESVREAVGLPVPVSKNPKDKPVLTNMQASEVAAKADAICYNENPQTNLPVKKGNSMKKTPNKLMFNGHLYRKAETLGKPTGEIFAVQKVAAKNQMLKTAAKTGDRPQAYVQYVDRGGTLMPMEDIKLTPKLHAGVYSIGYSPSGLVFERQAVNTDALLKFEDPIHRAVLDEMDTFWKQKEKYEKKGFLHNRAVLMYGPPGSGKSCLIKLATADLINSGDVVFTCSNVRDLNDGLKMFREVEPNRRCLAIMEDVDELSEHSLLQLLDGTNTADNIMYLATTNYINRLPPRVLRPGRFDRKIEVPYPPAAGRKAYLMDKLADENLSPEQMDDLVKKTEGFSFGHLRELVTAAFCIGQPIEEVLKRLHGNGLESADEHYSTKEVATAEAEKEEVEEALSKFLPKKKSASVEALPEKIRHKGLIYIKKG